MAFSRKMICWIIASLFFIEFLDETIIGTAIPRMAIALQASPLALKAAIISYLISLAIVVPTSAWFSECFGTRRMMLIAVAIFMLGSMGCALSNNLYELIVARIVQGIGGALIGPMGRMVMLHVFKKHEIVQAMNYVVIPSLLGSLLGPVLGGLIVTYFPWQFIFLINIPICVVGAFFITQYIPNIIADKKRSFDLTGFILLGVGLGGSSYAMESFGYHFMSYQLTWLLLFISLLSLLLCVNHTKHKKDPIIYFPLFKVMSFRIAFIATFFSRLSVASVPFLTPLLYQIKFGWSPLRSGLLIAPLAMGAMLTKLYSHVVLQRLGMKKTLVINATLLALSTMLFGVIEKTTSIIFIAMLSFITGGFLSLYYTSCNSTAYSELTEKTKMQGISLYSIVQRISTSYGVGITALVIETFLGTIHLTSSSPISAFHWTFFIIGLIGLLVPLLFLTLPGNVGSQIIYEED